MLNMFDPDFLPSIFILLITLCIIAFVYTNDSIEWKNIIIAGFVIRIILLYLDIFHIIPILGSGADTERFHLASLYNMDAIEKWKITNYTIFLELIYNLSNGSRLIAQYVNVLFGLFAIVLVQRIMHILKINRTSQLLPLLLMCFIPNISSMSAVLLRESWVVFFVSLSLYFFVKWFTYGGGISALLSIISVFSAAYMHSGVIFMLCGYFIAFITYSPQTLKVNITLKSYFVIVGIVLFFLFASSSLGVFTEKFEKLENADHLVTMTNKVNGGGSAYLQWIKTDNLLVALLVSPLKMIYFLFAPLPTEWRGLNDILAFLIDGLIYLYIVYNIFKNKILGHASIIRSYILISLLLVVFAFSYGTYNAGTAMRHRVKIIPVLVVAFAISKSNIKEEEDGV